MNLEVRVSVLGITFDGLFSDWNLETYYRSQMNDLDRDRILVRWNKPVAAIKAFHDEVTS